MFTNDLIAYGLTLLIGVVSGYAGSSYLKLKKIVSLLNEILKDDRITSEEVKQILELIR